MVVENIPEWKRLPNWTSEECSIVMKVKLEKHKQKQREVLASQYNRLFGMKQCVNIGGERKKSIESLQTVLKHDWGRSASGHYFAYKIYFLKSQDHTISALQNWDAHFFHEKKNLYGLENTNHYRCISRIGHWIDGVRLRHKVGTVLTFRYYIPCIPHDRFSSQWNHPTFSKNQVPIRFTYKLQPTVFQAW